MNEKQENKIQFTEKQQACIDTRKQDVLVSAAAGSGKTAVLVERIIQMILDEKDPVDIDRLLVVTFTKAAASQMREKVEKAIAKRLAIDPTNEHLERQAALVHHGQITTIHSFCNFVIRNSFHEIGLDPGFRVGESGEIKLLRQDVLQEVLEQCYEEKNEDFLALAECFSKGIDDGKLSQMIFQLYDVAKSYPFPELWLEEHRLDYQLQTDWEQTAWFQIARKQIELFCEAGLVDLQEAQRICESPSGPYMYGECIDATIESLQHFLCKLKEGADYATLQGMIQGIDYGTLSRKKDETVDPSLRERAKKLRDVSKKKIGDLKEKYFVFSKERITEQAELCHRQLSCLVMLVTKFEEAFSQKKREKNILDFSDLEHMALKILIRPTEDGRGYRQTETAKEYAKHFQYVMIDEYQDSNLVQEYLLESVSGDLNNQPNRFMVGDVKQSIYRFRLANPDIFLEKYDQYQTMDKDKIRIDLQQNFRSRREVIEGVNSIFRKIMKKELGGIDYDERAQLNLGASYPPVEDGQMDPELLLFYRDQDAQEKTDNIEVLGIAKRIQKMLQEEYVTDEETKTLRPVQYRDIVILLRSMGRQGEIYKKGLEEQGIPAYIASKSGYFGALEVSVLLQFLQVIHNPLQDIPLYGVLHSFAIGMTENELALIRSLEQAKAPYLYEQCMGFVQNDTYEELQGDEELQGIFHSAKAKLGSFFTRYQAFRKLSKYQSVYELLQSVMEETNYRSKLAAMMMGEKRLANVEMLLQKAADYEKTSFSGLYDFLRYMELLERYEIDYGEANTLGEQANVVRIMTMHASKGLEFPVCIVADLSKQINFQDSYGAFLVDAKMGIGMKCTDLSRRTISDTLRRTVVAEQIKQETLAEELRVLYVAMTRAKEKLILTAEVTKPEEEKQLYEKEPTLANLITGKSMLDYVLMGYDEMAPIKLMVIGTDALNYEAAGQMVAMQLRKDKLRRLFGGKEHILLPLQEKMERLWQFQYPYEQLKGLPTKTTVTELKKEAMLEPEEEAKELFADNTFTPYLPNFLGETKEVKGNQRGNAYHKFMELFPFARLLEKEPEEVLQEEIETMKQSGKLSEEYADILQQEKLLTFLQSPMAKRMARADRERSLYKEQPFVLGVSANLLRAELPEEETVLIQGIIDAFFEEEGGYVVVDYKTDLVHSEKTLIERYKTQLDYYAKAIGAMKGPVAKKVIYSFALGKEIVL